MIPRKNNKYYSKKQSLWYGQFLVSIVVMAYVTYSTGTPGGSPSNSNSSTLPISTNSKCIKNQWLIKIVLLHMATVGAFDSPDGLVCQNWITW